MTISSTELETRSNLNAGNVCLVIKDSNLSGDFVEKGTKVVLIKLTTGSKDIWLCNYCPLVKRQDNFCVSAENLQRY